MQGEHRQKISRTHPSFVGILIIAGLASLLLLLTMFGRFTKPSGKAEETEITQVKSALSTKPLSTICAQKGAQAISAFDTCRAGSIRLSTNKENPLFYCCKTP